MTAVEKPRGRDDDSAPPRVTDGEDERWVDEGGSSTPSAHGAGNDGRDRPMSPEDGSGSAAAAIDADDPHKVEKLTTLGHDQDPDEGSD